MTSAVNSGYERPRKDVAGGAASRPALLLAARGTPDRHGREAAEALADRVRAAEPGRQIAVGYLTWQMPTVLSAARGLIEGGAREIVAVPVTAHEESLVVTTLARRPATAL